jgi:IS30 family transposase
MTIVKKRGGKAITSHIENSFGLILKDLSELEPVPKPTKKSATSLIIEYHKEIKELLNRGFSAEQIVNELSARINLDLSPETLRTVIRNTDDKGNRITKKQKSTSRRQRTSTNAPSTTHLNGAPTTPENPNDEQEENQTPITIVPSEKHKKRSPITIDEDL